MKMTQLPISSPLSSSSASSSSLLWRVIRITIIFFIPFFLLFILINGISPGHVSLREPFVTKPVLRIRPEGNFTIGIFADLHYGEEESGWGVDQDRKSRRVMEAVLREESADLVVLNGDLITGENTFRENSSRYVDQIVEPLIDAVTPWASVYGNHDSQFNLSREAILRAEQVYDLCYTDSMGEGRLPGVTNYYIVVYGPDEQGQRPGATYPEAALILWFFDSRGDKPYQQSSPESGDIPDWVAPETAEWFSKTHNGLQREFARDGRGPVPSLAFVHIPPHVFRRAQDVGVDAKHFPGLNDDKPLAFQGRGAEDSAFVRALRGAEGMHSVYVGHDHGDSWCSTWPTSSSPLSSAESGGPFLCFAKHTGYGGYGDWDRGARMVSVTFASDEEAEHGQGAVASVETWVRMENGTVITHVALNETYGDDVYASSSSSS